MLKTVNEEGWCPVTANCWQTQYESVSWAYNQSLSANGTGGTPWFQGSLFKIYQTSSEELKCPARKRDTVDTPKSNLTLSTDLCGVQCAIDTLTSYEVDVGLYFTAPPSGGGHGIDLSVPVDEEAVSRGRKHWEIYAEVLTCGLRGAPTCSDRSLISFIAENDMSRASSPSSSRGDLHRSTSTLSSLDFTDSDFSTKSVSAPSTPKGRSTDTIVQAKDVSPGKTGGAFHTSSQNGNRRLNAYASSFIPSKAKSEPFTFPSSVISKQGTSPQLSAAEYNFSSDDASLATVKVQRDEQGFYSEAEVASPTPQSQRAEYSFLPPFLQEFPRRKAPASKTRAMVDRLRSAHSHSHSPSPNPPLYDMSLFDERIYVSEDDRPRSSGVSSPSSQEEEDEGWVNIAEVDKATRESKARRTRNLFLALTRRRSDPATPNDTSDPKLDDQQVIEIPVATSPASFVSPLPSPDCGWVEGPSPSPGEVAFQRRQTEPRSHSHRKRRSSSQAALPPPAHVILPHFMHSTALRTPTGLTHTPFLPTAPYISSQTPANFYSTYPSMMSSMTYTSYVQQLQALQLQMRRSGGSHRSIAPHSYEWTQYPTSGMGQFSTANTLSQPISVSGSLVQRDSSW